MKEEKENLVFQGLPGLLGGGVEPVRRDLREHRVE